MFDRDTLLGMAREAGFPFNKYGLLQGDEDGEIEADALFKRYAELVAAKEREACRVAARNAVLALSEANRRSGDLLDHAIDAAIRRRDQKAACWCETCRPNTLEDQRLIVCSTCGNKRCPRATHHDNECTGSNAPGQKGSSWENVKPAAIRARGATDGKPT